VPIASTEQRRREFGARRPLTDANPGLLPQDNAKGIDRFAEDLIVRRERPAGGGETLERRAPESRSTGHREDTGNVDQWTQRPLRELECRETFSDVIHHFNGGNGVIGLHGTNEPGKVGTDVSHGCIRLRNEDITYLAQRLPLGTPVRILA